MTEIDLSKRSIAIFGTGSWSLFARFVARISFVFVDSQYLPYRTLVPEVSIHTGPFKDSILDNIDLIVLSPASLWKNPFWLKPAIVALK